MSEQAATTLSQGERICPGCGTRLPISDGQPDPRYNASPECWRRYLEVYADTLTMARDLNFFHHQLAVDAYGAQHVAANAKPIGVAFALIGLYLTYDRGYSGRQVQHMHALLAQRSKVWPRFARPEHPGVLTISDVVAAPPGGQRVDMLWRWGQAVWDAWDAEHERVKDLFERVMAD